jgi:pimeloyl-ACP methyl ester carboxylesterase
VRKSEYDMAKERTRKISRRDDLAIETYIDGKGPALVILPSYGRDGATDYDIFASELVAAGYQMLRPQPRGVAASRGPMQDLSLHDLAADISLAIRDWADGRAVVLGHAFGNLVARMLATDFPSMVKGLILASAQAKVVAPAIAKTPAAACDLRSPIERRLAALKLGFFARIMTQAFGLTGGTQKHSICKCTVLGRRARANPNTGWLETRRCWR